MVGEHMPRSSLSVKGPGVALSNLSADLLSSCFLLLEKKTLCKETYLVRIFDYNIMIIVSSNIKRAPDIVNSYMCSYTFTTGGFANFDKQPIISRTST